MTEEINEKARNFQQMKAALVANFAKLKTLEQETAKQETVLGVAEAYGERLGLGVTTTLASTTDTNTRDRETQNLGITDDRLQQEQQGGEKC